MKENKVPTLSIVHDMPEKIPAKKDDLDTVFGRKPQPSQHQYVLHSKDTGQKVEIKEFPFTIGRALTSDLVIMDKIVSRNHAVIDLEEGHIVIENKGSLNGVRVNSRKIDRVALLNKDEIVIASATYVLQIERINKSKTTMPAELDDPQAQQDSYTNKAASNDDLLGNDQLAMSEDEPGIHQQAEQLASKVSNKTLYTLISITVLVAIATVVTLFQSTPDLGIALDDIEGADTKITSLPTERETAAAGADRYPDTLTKPQNVAGNTATGYQPIRAPRVVDTQAAESQGVPDGEVETTFPEDSTAVGTAKPDVEPSDVITTPPNTVIAKRDIEETNNVAVEKPVEPEVVQPRVVKPPVVKYSRYSGRTSEIKLENAKGFYVDGQYHVSQRELKSIYNNNRHGQQYRNQARSMKEQFRNLYALYSQGQSEYNRNSKPKAFKTWASFMKKERALLNGRTSQYARNVKKTVALEYEEKGRQAYMRDDWRTAFRYWKSSLKMRPNSSISDVMRKMESEIAALYNSGSKFEKTNKSEAIRYWTEVVNKAPDNHEYYIKAKAKLRWLKSASQ